MTTFQNAAVCGLTFGAFIIGIATTLLYVIKKRYVAIVPPLDPRPRATNIYRSEMPTLTGIPVAKQIGQLARECREKEER